MEKQINTHDLLYFTGTESYHYDPLISYANYTDGVKFIRANGLAWLVTDILLYGKDLLKTNDFLSFTIDRDRKILEVVGDTEEKITVFTYNSIDLRGLQKIQLFFANSYPKPVLMLASEY